MVRGSCAHDHDGARFIVEVGPEAQRGFREAFLWYFERSPVAADAFRVQVLGAIDGLADRADMWPADADGVLRVLDVGRCSSAASGDVEHVA